MRRLALLAGLLTAAWAGLASAACRDQGDFTHPQAVLVSGYDDDLMEPFVSRDGAVLFFNNRNDPPGRTDLRWAEAQAGGGFAYRGLVEGANSPDLDGVPTMAADGSFCFVSPRDYRATLNSVFCGHWAGGVVTALEPQTALSARKLGRLDFDVEISANGRWLYYVEGLFDGGPVPRSAQLRLAERTPEGFRPRPGGDATLASFNALGRVYAPAISADGCEMVVTRLSGVFPFLSTSLWRAARPGPGAPFGKPHRLAAITGFVEGATFGPDGRSLYFHRKDGERFRLYRATR